MIGSDVIESIDFSSSYHSYSSGDFVRSRHPYHDASLEDTVSARALVPVRELGGTLVRLQELHHAGAPSLLCISSLMPLL